MIRLDAATVLLQWAVGGLFFGWVTTRRREVGVGYGWLVRGVYLVLAAGSLAAALLLGPVPGRDLATVGVIGATATALVVSVLRRRAGVAGERARRQQKSARVGAMTGARPAPATPASPATPATPATPAVPAPEAPRDRPGVGARTAEFPPVLDLVAPVVGVAGLIAAGLAAGGDPVLAVVRTVVGAAFLGAVTDAMLLGHWYLVQPGLHRGPLRELVRWLTALWAVEVGVLLIPPGMVSVLTGAVDDGYNGILGWFWLACAVMTIVLCLVTRAALKERFYSAVMAATGLLYLAIVTVFGTDLVARAVLAP
ncbi:MAG: hypothetical protein KY452_12340 [Actinobacteria bacterium]|nr:hypothetical protein [Actinomycetota bacterium]